MVSISSNGKDKINKVVEEIFDRIALKFIGDLPSLREAKRLIISSEPHLGLSHLFVQAMANKHLNTIEKDVLKSLLESSNGYIQALKARTRTDIAEKIDGLAREANLQGRKIGKKDVELLLEEGFKKAGSDLKIIMESESTKFRNLGTAMDVSRVAASIGDPDPTVFFSMVRDDVTCKECIRLHTIDGVTPSLWKLSELNTGYGKRGDTVPSLLNRHPNCRCSLVYLTKGFGFDKKGRITYHSENHDAYLEQLKRRA